MGEAHSPPEVGAEPGRSAAGLRGAAPARPGAARRAAADRPSAAESGSSLAWLETLARGAGHDFSAPIRHVDGFVQIARAQLAEGDRAGAEESLATLATTGEHLARLVDGLVQCLRLEARAVQRQWVALGPLLERTLAPLQPELQRLGAEVRHAALPEVWADAYLLERLLQHLMDNSLRFRSTRPLRIAVHAERDGPLWSIHLADNGLGIPEPRRASLFAPFRSVPREGTVRGAGLGLYVCRRIAERHGGRIRCDDVPGGGVEMQIALPCPAEREFPAGAPPR